MTVLTQTIVSPRLSLVTDIKSISVTNNNNVKVNEKREGGVYLDLYRL